MSQSAVHPHDISNLLEPALIEIVHAVSDRPGQTKAAYEAKSDATWALVESFQPRDVIDLLLSGQLIAFNAAFADATHGLLQGMEDTLKKQTLSSLVSMGRVTQGHLDRLAKRGNHPYQTEVAPPPPARPNVAAPARVTEPPPVAAPLTVERPPASTAGPLAAPPARAAALPAAPPVRTATPSAALPTGGTTLSTARGLAPEAVPCSPTSEAPPWAGEPPGNASGSPVEEISWLDEPYQEYVIQTPGLLAAQKETARTVAALMLIAATRKGKGADDPPIDANAEPTAASES